MFYFTCASRFISEHVKKPWNYSETLKQLVLFRKHVEFDVSVINNVVTPSSEHCVIIILIISCCWSVPPT